MTARIGLHSLGSLRDAVLRRLRAGLVGAAASIALTMPPVAVHAQEISGIEAAQQERELSYQASLRAFEAAQAARAALQSRFDRLSEELGLARTEGDEERRDQALAELQRLSTDLGSADRRVEETAAALEDARTAYMGLLDARLDILAQQIEYEPDEDDRAILFALYQDLSNRFDELDAAGANGLATLPVVLPNIRAQPTDGPVELRVKAELLERHAAKFDTLIATISVEVDDLEKRFRRDRTTRGFLAGIDRFGDVNLPVAPTRGAGETRPGQDPEAGSQSLSERLDGLRLLMDRYEAQRLEAANRAESLRRLAVQIRGTIG